MCVDLRRVMHRQHAHRSLLADCVDDIHTVDHIGGQVGVCQHDGLVGACCAAGKQYLRRGVQVEVDVAVYAVLFKCRSCRYKFFIEGIAFDLAVNGNDCLKFAAG